MISWGLRYFPGSGDRTAVTVLAGPSLSERREVGRLVLDAGEIEDLRGRLSGEFNPDDPETCPVDHTCDEEGVCGCWCEVHDCRIAECPTFRLVDSWLTDAARKTHAAEGKVTALRDELDRARRVGNEAAAEAEKLRAFVDQIRWLRDAWSTAPGRSEQADALDAALDELRESGADAPRGSVHPVSYVAEALARADAIDRRASGTDPNPTEENR